MIRVLVQWRCDGDGLSEMNQWLRDRGLWRSTLEEGREFYSIENTSVILRESGKVGTGFFVFDDSAKDVALLFKLTFST